jgi:glycolate oxidase
MPNKEGVVLSLAKFNRIVEIDPLARTARLQPGVRNLAISEEAAQYGLYYGPDPSSQIACTIGGNVAENSGGVHCLKYGLTVHNILSVEMVTAEGDVVTVGSDGLDGCGMDLLALMTGSEGLLGVVTEVKVKLLPKPEVAQVVMAGFDDVQKGGDAVGGIISHGIIPGGLEMMDGHAIIAADDFAQAGYPRDAKALLLCEVDGTIPRREIAYVLTEMEKMSEEFGLRVANVFHAGDGNLHPLILFDANVPGEFERTEAFGSRILEMCVEVGGCITGEHGVGVEKIRQMAVQFNDEELQQFHDVKAAFDPAGILNPGKGVPALRFCQEYRSLEHKQHTHEHTEAAHG